MNVVNGKCLAICVLNILLITLTFGCANRSSFNSSGIAHGMMAGEVTASSVILQCRLSSGEPVDGDIPGTSGYAYFELSQKKNFKNSFKTKLLVAKPQNDFIFKTKVADLKTATRYYYRLCIPAENKTIYSHVAIFKTLAGKAGTESVKFVVVTGMNYAKFHHGSQGKKAYAGPDKHLGYPALESIGMHRPDFFVGTGDNVYYDVPKKDSAKTISQMRKKHHEQFAQRRFAELFRSVPTYWEKDDHDHRYNDCDNSGDRLPSSKLGINVFKEQFPVTAPQNPEAVTYRTHRINKNLQIWLVEGRDYRSDNDSVDGPEKTIWGETQKQWLKDTLLDSDAAFKILISPTPMIGPDDAYKKDNHTNHKGFRYEGDEFFKWLKDNDFDKKGFYIICGDRHWQYHSIRPDGFEEFSCGALIDANARIGRIPGDKKSTDPNAEITQPYCMQTPSGGFLEVIISNEKKLTAEFNFYDEKAISLYSTIKNVQ